MRLSSFIHDTIFEIALGVQLARARSRELVAVAPLSIDGEAVAEKTYVEFDVAVVVAENEEKVKGGDSKAGVEIQVASLMKASVDVGGKLAATSKSSAEQTHRITFKVPIFMNADFRNNAMADAYAEDLFATHGIEDTLAKLPGIKTTGS